MPTFSVIIPVYNVAPYLRECLDSVLAQTYGDWEAICVDDGSTDGSGAILDEYAEKDARFKVIHQSNAGVSAARNRALQMIVGEWFTFLDGDDVLRPDALNHFSSIVEEESCDGVLIHPYLEWLESEKVGKMSPPFTVIDRCRNGAHLMTGEMSANGYPFGRLYRSKTFRHLRFPAGVGMAEDIWFWSDAICVTAGWVVARGSYYLYRQRAGSASHLYNPEWYVQLTNSISHAFGSIIGLGCGPLGVKEYWERYHWSCCERVEGVFDVWWECNKLQRNVICQYVEFVERTIPGARFSTRLDRLCRMHRRNLGVLVSIWMLPFMVRAIFLRTVPPTGRIRTLYRRLRRHGEFSKDVS